MPHIKFPISIFEDDVARAIYKHGFWICTISLGVSLCVMPTTKANAIVLTGFLFADLAIYAACCLTSFYKEYKKRQAQQQAWKDHVDKELKSIKSVSEWDSKRGRDMFFRLNRLESDLKEIQQYK